MDKVVFQTNWVLRARALNIYLTEQNTRNFYGAYLLRFSPLRIAVACEVVRENGKVKVKLTLGLTKHHAMTTYVWVEYISTQSRC
jgi:hypothetical protein